MTESYFVSWFIVVVFLFAPTKESCFPKDQGYIGDVSVDVDHVNQLNNYEILPRLQRIVERDFFHFFEVNLARGCPFSTEPAACRSFECHVSNCRVEEVPVGLRTEAMLQPSSAYHKYDKAVNTGEADTLDDVDCELGKLDSSLSDERRTILGNWTMHDAMNEYNFCDLDDITSDKTIWVDLLKNPEQFTGYKGVSSNRIWHMIYAENCFNDDNTGIRTLSPSPEMLRCLEKRVFYRLISGLHTSITVHLCAKAPQSVFNPTQSGSSLDTLATTTWGPKPDEFYKRFHPNLIPQGLDRLRSLYFAYLVELRALAKVGPYLRTLTFYTGDPEADAETRAAVNDLLDIVKVKGNLFDERQLFVGQTEEAKTLKHQMREHFYNISRIMDCVGCDKCRLWGKLQTVGMGTALKILFSTPNSTFSDPTAIDPSFQLSRREIVALINALNRLSNSIGSLRNLCVPESRWTNV